MASCFEPANRLKSRVSPNTATCGVKLLSATLNVVEKFVGAPPDGSDSSIISTARANGPAIADVNVAATATNQIITQQEATFPNILTVTARTLNARAKNESATGTKKHCTAASYALFVLPARLQRNYYIKRRCTARMLTTFEAWPLSCLEA